MQGTGGELKMELSQCFGEVPVCGEWKKFDVSLRVHILLMKQELVHYVDGKPKEKDLHPLRHYYHIHSVDIASHIASEIKAWSMLTNWSFEEIIQLLRVAMTKKEVMK